MHPKLDKLLERRDAMSVEGGIDWGYASPGAAIIAGVRGDDCIDPWCAVVTVETEWSAGRKAVAS